MDQGAAPYIQGWFAYSQGHAYPLWHEAHRQKWFKDDWHRGFFEACEFYATSRKKIPIHYRHNPLAA